MTDIYLDGTLPPTEKQIGVRVPLPDPVLMYIERERHPRGGSCLMLRYTRSQERDLITTLEEAIAAIKAGPSDAT